MNHLFPSRAVCTLLVAGLLAARAQPIAVSADFATVRYAIDPLAFGVNAFKGTDSAITGATGYLTNLRYLLGDRQGGGMIRIHTWEMMRDGAGSWMGIDHGWDAVKTRRAVGNLVDAGFNVTINIPATPGDDAVTSAQDFADACAALVRIINVDGGLGIRWWEILNERDNTFSADVNALITRYNLAAAAMKAVDPTIVCGGPAFQYPHQTTYVKAFIDGTLDDLGFCSIHNYGGDGTQPDTTTYKNAGARWYCSYIAEYLRQKSPGRKIPLWYDEFNVSWTWEAGQAKMNGMVGAVYDALTLSRSLDYGADILTAWNECDGVYGKMSTSYDLRPAAHVFHLFNAYVYGSRISSTTGDSLKVVPYASRSPGGRHTIVLTNRSTVAQTVTVAISGWTPAGPMECHQVSAGAQSRLADMSPAQLGTGGMQLPPESVTLLTREEPSRSTVLLTGDPRLAPPPQPEGRFGIHGRKIVRRGSGPGPVLVVVAGTARHSRLGLSLLGR